MEKNRNKLHSNWNVEVSDEIGGQSAQRGFIKKVLISQKSKLAKEPIRRSAILHKLASQDSSRDRKLGINIVVPQLVSNNSS